jgi:hypothetical protein
MAAKQRIRYGLSIFGGLFSSAPALISSLLGDELDGDSREELQALTSRSIVHKLSSLNMG